ncbi:MAG: hypothetical protein SOY42_11095 [Clostridium sp.]|nr:hypothetical protein [Clostridium sp.]
MKKRLISLIIAGIIGATLVGCGGENKKTESPKNTEVKTEENNNENEKNKNQEKVDKNVVDDDGDGVGYTPLTNEEIIKIHPEKLASFREFFKKINLTPDEGDNSKTEGDKIEGIAYLNWQAGEKATIPGYGGISYSAQAGSNVTQISYDFYYFIDDENKQVPQVKDLYITEPYKILTGTDMSQETIDKLNQVLKDAYEHDINTDESDIIIEEKGNFQTYVSMTSYQLMFVIVSQ